MGTIGLFVGQHDDIEIGSNVFGDLQVVERSDQFAIGEYRRILFERLTQNVATQFVEMPVVRFVNERKIEPDEAGGQKEIKEIGEIEERGEA